MAEGYLNSKRIKGVTALSCGFISEGESVSENSALVMKEIGIDISSHKSRLISPELVNADKIFCMSESHKNALILSGVNAQKVSVLGGGIPDPFGQSAEVYRLCRDEIVKAVNNALYGGEILPFKIINAEKQDADSVAKLERECFSEPWSIEAINEAFDFGAHFFKAEKDGKFAGYISFKAISGEGYINNIAVDAKMRNSGIGSMLLDRAITFAREQNLEFLSLEVRASNKSAISLYRKLGFIQEGLRKNFYDNPKEDGIIMTRRFTI